jgi:hypothetical protein
MIKLNVVDLEKLYNFVVKNFFIWIRLGLQNSIWIFLCRVFYFVLALSNKEMIKINVVDLKKLYNFVVKNFFIWIRLGLQNSIWIFFCRVFYFWHLGKEGLCRVSKKNTRQRIFKFKKFKCSFSMTRWFQNKKWSTTKFHIFLRSTKFIYRVYIRCCLKKSKFKIFN